MKKYLIIALIGLMMGISIMTQKYNEAMKKWEVAEGNVKAYSEMLSSSEDKNRALQLTADQLENFKDSIIVKLDSTRKALGIKNKQIKSLQYVSSTFVRTDTITLVGDTIFKEPSLAIDTIIGDEWYKVNLGLYYPSKITVSPELKSEKHIIVFSKRETVNPPKKFFLLRWFQRKHTVLNIDVVEKNPYINSENNRYIEIIE